MQPGSSEVSTASTLTSFCCPWLTSLRATCKQKQSFQESMTHPWRQPQPTLVPGVRSLPPTYSLLTLVLPPPPISSFLLLFLSPFKPARPINIHTMTEPSLVVITFKYLSQYIFSPETNKLSENKCCGLPS